MTCCSLAAGDGLPISAGSPCRAGTRCATHFKRAPRGRPSRDASRDDGPASTACRPASQPPRARPESGPFRVRRGPVRAGRGPPVSSRGRSPTRPRAPSRPRARAPKPPPREATRAKKTPARGPPSRGRDLGPPGWGGACLPASNPPPLLGGPLGRREGLLRPPFLAPCGPFRARKRPKRRGAQHAPGAGALWAPQQPALRAGLGAGCAHDRGRAGEGRA
eukprot:scaffold2089_cov336-Prasinococcus_capsulatus_cf.AAC.1